MLGARAICAPRNELGEHEAHAWPCFTDLWASGLHGAAGAAPQARLTNPGRRGNAVCRASRGWTGQAGNCTTDTTSSTSATASSRAERTGQRLPMPTRNATAAGGTLRRAYVSAELAAASPMGPSALRRNLRLAGRRLYANMNTNPARSARRRPRVFLGGRYRESPARRSPPRRALVPPRTEPRGANPYARRHRSHPPPDHRWRHSSRTVELARSCACAPVKNVGGEARAPAASRAARARPIAVHAATGSSAWASASLRRGAIPTQADRV